MRQFQVIRFFVLTVGLAALIAAASTPPAAFAKPAHRPATTAPRKTTRHGLAGHAVLKGPAFKWVRRHGKLVKVSLARVAPRPSPLIEADSTRHAYAACSDAPEKFVKAAALNARSLDELDWAPFGAPEKGWQVYDVLVGREIGADCGSGTPVFAQKLADFQAKYLLPADGVFTPATFEVFKGLLQERRPFVMARVAKLCPEAPDAAALVALPKEAETFEREGRMIRADVWLAYQQMVAAARAELPQLQSDPKALTIFSGYRSPESDAIRCDTQNNCDGLRRAACSAHRTGTAIDLNVGWVEGVAADSTTPENRLLQTRTAPYRWLVMNAQRFGFVNYAYEPWHWEWIGEPGKPALGVIPPPPTAPPTTDPAVAPPATSGPAKPAAPSTTVPKA